LGAALSADVVALIKPELIVPFVDWYVKSENRISHKYVFRRPAWH